MMPDYNFSQTAIININKLIHNLNLKLRLSDKNMFSTNELVDFFILSLTDFNQAIPITNLSFDDTFGIELFAEALVTCALSYASSPKDDVLHESNLKKIKTMKYYITYWNFEIGDE